MGSGLEWVGAVGGALASLGALYLIWREHIDRRKSEVEADRREARERKLQASLVYVQSPTGTRLEDGLCIAYTATAVNKSRGVITNVRVTLVFEDPELQEIT